MNILTLSQAQRVLKDLDTKVDLEQYCLVADRDRYFVVSKDIQQIDLTLYTVKRIGLPL